MNSTTTLESSSPAVTLGPAKAIVAAVTGALVGGLTALGTALTDGAITPAEWVAVALATLLGSGLTGGATYAKSTTVTLN